jgi:HSP20 family protein
MAQTKNNTAIEKRPDATNTNANENSNAVTVPDRQQQQQQEAAAAAAWYTPLVDVIENEDGFVFQADLPGVKPGDVDVSFENGSLVIEAEAAPRQPAGRSYLWREYGVGNFYRSFNIAAPVDADAIKAQLKNGVLELNVPKAESAKPRKVKVQAD